MSLRFKVVIPARYGSARLPGKPLLTIAGKPMIAHVCQRAQEAEAEDVVVATDDDRIYQAVIDLGMNAMMTRTDHNSGTERIAEVAQQLGWPAEDIIVNLQGDEPLIAPSFIREVASALAEQQVAGMATLAAKVIDVEEVFNPNAVKVVLNQRGYALYFSRAPIPWDRDRFNQDYGRTLSGKMPYYRHIGMYAYTVGFLNRYCQWGSCAIESVESLEQLRILWHGEAIAVRIVDSIPPAGVDTETDLLRVERILKTQPGCSTI